MTALFPNVGANSPALLYKQIDYNSLLTQPFDDNELFVDFTDSMTTLFDGVVHYAADQLYYMRDDENDPLFVAYNTRMLGFQVPLYSFTTQQYQNLLQSLGTFYQTKGASLQFLNFLAYIESTQFTFLPLWATSLTESITALTDTPGTPIWQTGGTYFPTPYYDLQYNPLEYPNLNVQQFLNILYTISPIYLVPRSILFITITQTNLYVTPCAYDTEYTRVLTQ